MIQNILQNFENENIHLNVYMFIHSSFHRAISECMCLRTYSTTMTSAIDHAK